MSRFLRKLGGLLALAAMMILALITGIFLAAVGKAQQPTPPTNAPPATNPATSTSATTSASAPATTRKTVDVSETQQGQPVPRNLLE